MLTFFLLCLLALRGVHGYYAEYGVSKEGLGFVVMPLECGESHCSKCYVSKPGGITYLNVFEVTKNPTKYELNIAGLGNDWTFDVTQDNMQEPFRFCYETSAYNRDGTTFGYQVCLEDFLQPGSAIPEECAEPVALYTVNGHFDDDRIRGQQALFCKTNDQLG